MHIRNISVRKKSYNADITALDDISVNFDRRINVIYGEPGSGKTTLLETIAGIEKSVKGSINIAGNKILLMQVPERQFVYPTCKMELCPEKGDLADAAINDLLSYVGLSGDILKLSPWQLSKGEKKRLVIARMLSTDIAHYENNIFLLDDPFLDLDKAGKLLIIERIIKEDKFKIILAISNNYDLQFLVDEKIDFKLIKLKEGRVID